MTNTLTAALAVLTALVATPASSLALASPATASDDGRAPCVPLGPADEVLVDLREASLGDVARLVSCATERNILFSPAALAQRQVTVISARPIGRRALVALWHTLLADNDLVGERRGAYEVVRPAQP